MESSRFIDQIAAINTQAFEETKSLIQNSNGNYIYIQDWEDEFEARANGATLSVRGVGLNEEGHICIFAIVDNVGYGFSGDEYPEGWTDITNDPIESDCYAEMYRFVADNIDKAMSRNQVDELIVVKHYNS